MRSGPAHRPLPESEDPVPVGEVHGHRRDGDDGVEEKAVPGDAEEYLLLPPVLQPVSEHVSSKDLKFLMPYGPTVFLPERIPPLL